MSPRPFDYNEQPAKGVLRLNGAYENMDKADLFGRYADGLQQ
jgi:hypothetical protein